MIPRTCRGRSGVTLTEILISILILGIGIVSLATLFPLGLLRLRDAARQSRSGILGESAYGDLGARNLLNKVSFLTAAMNASTPPWYGSPYTYDPWNQDTPSYGGNPFASPYGAYRGPAPASSGLPYQAGSGLPVAYDPLWRATTGIYPNSTVTEARFASGIGFVRPDPNGSKSTDASAHGLPRLTNLPPALASVASDIFVSPEDIVLQDSTDNTAGNNNLSPVVPDLNLGTNAATGLVAPQYDWRYTWMFTGQQADCTYPYMFDGEIVVFENRPFAFDANAVVPFSHTAAVAGGITGETVVEAVFGYSSNASGNGYGGNASRVVLLRWSDKVPDPEVKVGNWIADVTYERNGTEDAQRSLLDVNSVVTTTSNINYFPYQRCYWYQVAKRTAAGPGVAFSGDPAGINYRQMTVWTTTPLRAFTLLNKGSSSPYHVNAALVSPYVVNVFSKTVYTR